MEQSIYVRPSIYTSGFRSQEERIRQNLSFLMAISAMQSPGWLLWPVSCGTWLLQPAGNLLSGISSSPHFLGTQLGPHSLFSCPGYHLLHLSSPLSCMSLSPGSLAGWLPSQSLHVRSIHNMAAVSIVTRGLCWIVTLMMVLSDLTHLCPLC